MSIQILRDLRGLRIQVVHPADNEGLALVEHLKRIGCSCTTTWPLPDAFSPQSDVVFLSVDQESRDRILKLVRDADGKGPTLLAIGHLEEPVGERRAVGDDGRIGVAAGAGHVNPGYGGLGRAAIRGSRPHAGAVRPSIQMNRLML